MDEFAKLSRVQISDLRTHLQSNEDTQTREFQALDKRMQQLTEWLQRDSNRLFDEMNKTTEKTNICDKNMQAVTHLVNELQAKEDRNDGFMQDLLQRAEKLE